jgi:hypothetical protein
VELRGETFALKAEDIIRKVKTLLEAKKRTINAEKICCFISYRVLTDAPIANLLHGYFETHWQVVEPKSAPFSVSSSTGSPYYFTIGRKKGERFCILLLNRLCRSGTILTVLSDHIHDAELFLVHNDFIDRFSEDLETRRKTATNLASDIKMP